jgi:plastocyanin
MIDGMKQLTWLGLVGVLVWSTGCSGGSDDSTTGESTTRGASSAASGGGETPLNGCTPAAAEDQTANAAVTLPWEFPHQRCVTVAVGSTVTWEGSFSSHPLRGGEAGELDEDNPITSGDAASPPPTVSITFDEEGDYPYFCDVHNTMQGVVYVR